MRRTISSGLLATLLTLTLSAFSMPAASAAGEVLDRYCGESGDFCTYVIEKETGTIVFQIVGFANYFGRSQACVTKDTRVCHARSPRRVHGVFRWSIAWQGHYPDEGPGRYAVRWYSSGDARIGPALHFER